MDLNELINQQEQLNIQIEGEEEQKLIAEGSIIQLVSFRP